MKRNGAAQRTVWVNFNGSTGSLVMSGELQEVKNFSVEKFMKRNGAAIVFLSKFLKWFFLVY
jgi:hypothetical protein